MKNELLKHQVAYVILLIGLGILTIAFLAVWPNHLYQRTVIGGFFVFYIAWGVGTHVKTDSISRRVVMEYASVSFLASLLLLLVTF